jgi:hypothetical protein
MVYPSSPFRVAPSAHKRAPCSPRVLAPMLEVRLVVLALARSGDHYGMAMIGFVLAETIFPGER